MSQPRKRLLAAAFLALCTSGAGTASALGYYAEILTADAFPVWSDVRASTTLSVDFDPLAYDWTGMGAPPGLGSGLVTESAPLGFTHVFDPTPDAQSVLRAWLAISVVDDQLVDPPEQAEVELDGSFWQTGQATLNLLFGEITALGLITADGDEVDVLVSSVQGLGNRDFVVLASALKVEFVVLPEGGPSVLLGFGLLSGAAFLGRRQADR